MLNDSDRIFTNLYGALDWHLEGARKRGAWDGTSALIANGHDWVVDQVKELPSSMSITKTPNHLPPTWLILTCKSLPPFI